MPPHFRPCLTVSHPGGGGYEDVGGERRVVLAEYGGKQGRRPLDLLGCHHHAAAHPCNAVSPLGVSSPVSGWAIWLCQLTLGIGSIEVQVDDAMPLPCGGDDDGR